MPICPSCHDEYSDPTRECTSCGIALVPDGVPLPPRVDRLLGVFHPLVAIRVVALCDRRGIHHDTVPLDADQIEVVVDRAFRDDLRAELATNWPGIVNSLDVDDRVAVIRAGGRQPGWFDAPESAWVDRAGRLQVDRGADEEAMDEAARLWGPTLVAVGTVVALFGWYGQGSGGLAVFGLALAGLGLFLPR